MIFVTGATGFLGGRLTQVLHACGEDVTVLARPGSDLRHLAGLKLTVAHGDLSDSIWLSSAVKDASHILHCAACSTDWAPAGTYLAANVTGTANLLAAARDAPHLQRFVHISTTDIYGYPETPCGEDHPIFDAGLLYNQTKGRAEQLVWQAHQQHNLPMTILRPATIFGPRGKDFTQEIAAMLRQRMMATIDHGRAPGGFTYVDNVVDAIRLASSHGHSLGRAYNVTDGTGATWLEYLTQFAAQLKLPMPWMDFSFAAAWNAARLFEATHRALRLRGRPLLTRHAVYLLGRNQEFPIDRLTQDLDFRPAVSFEEGITRSAAWVHDSRPHSR